VLVLAVALVAARLIFGSDPMTNRADWPFEFQSNGQRVDAAAERLAAWLVTESDTLELGEREVSSV